MGGMRRRGGGIRGLGKRHALASGRSSVHAGPVGGSERHDGQRRSGAWELFGYLAAGNNEHVDAEIEVTRGNFFLHSYSTVP